AADLELCSRRPGGTLDACASRPATTGARRRGANLPTLGRLGVASLRDQDPARHRTLSHLALPVVLRRQGRRRLGPHQDDRHPRTQRSQLRRVLDLDARRPARRFAQHHHHLGRERVGLSGGARRGQPRHLWHVGFRRRRSRGSRHLEWLDPLGWNQLGVPAGLHRRTLSVASGDLPAAGMEPLTLFAFLAIYIIWGSTYLGIKIAGETLPPFLLAGARFI